MADTSLYESDVLAWSEQQADALRELAVRRDLPNALDLTNVIEEIESVGLSELAAVKSHIRLILVHALKCVAAPEAQSVRHWHAEIRNWQAGLSDRFAPSMRQRLDLATLWRRAIPEAEDQLAAQGLAVGPAWSRLGLTSADCPLTIDDLLADPPDPAALVARLGHALSPS